MSGTRTQVIFYHPSEFVPLSVDDGVMSVAGSAWFLVLLRKMPGWEIDSELCQEYWGVVAFISRGKEKFWAGLSAMDEGEWLAHFHHGSLAWFQRFTSSGKNELASLARDFHDVLAAESSVSQMNWYWADDIMFKKGAKDRPDA